MIAPEAIPNVPEGHWFGQEPEVRARREHITGALLHVKKYLDDPNTRGGSYHTCPLSQLRFCWNRPTKANLVIGLLIAYLGLHHWCSKCPEHKEGRILDSVYPHTLQQHIAGLLEDRALSCSVVSVRQMACGNKWERKQLRIGSIVEFSARGWHVQCRPTHTRSPKRQHEHAQYNFIKIVQYKNDKE